MIMTDVKAVKHVIVKKSRTLAHVFHCPFRRDATRTHQPIVDGCSAKLFRISYVAVEKKNNCPFYEPIGYWSIRPIGSRTSPCVF